LVETDGLLAAIEPDEIGALANTRAFTPVFMRNGQLVIVAPEVAFRTLDLDHARAGIRQPAAAHRRGHRLLE
jgi:hypothetical protein